jgi:hypothetical protein
MVGPSAVVVRLCGSPIATRCARGVAGANCVWCYAVTRCRAPGDAATTRYTAMAATTIPAIPSLFRAI